MHGDYLTPAVHSALRGAWSQGYLFNKKSLTPGRQGVVRGGVRLAVRVGFRDF